MSCYTAIVNDLTEYYKIYGFMYMCVHQMC